MELSERANRALLEETVRLQAELKSSARQKQHGIGDERAERNQLSDKMSALTSTIHALEAKLNRVAESSSSDASIIRHLTERLDRFEKHSLNVHQDRTLKGNETSSRFDQVRHDIEDIRQQQRLMSQTQDKTLRSVTGDVASLKSRMDRLSMETQELASDLKQRASRVEVELRGTVEVIGALRSDHSSLAGSLSSLQVGVTAQLEEGKARSEEIIRRMMHHDQHKGDEQEQFVRQLSATNAKLEAIEERSADVLRQANEAVERFQGSQSSTKAEVDERIAEVATAQAKQLATLGSELRQEIQAQDSSFSAALAAITQAQHTFEQDVSATATQRARAAEAKIASEAETIRSQVKLAKLEAQQSLAALQKNIEVVDRHLMATRKNVEKVLKAEISLRKEGNVKQEQALRNARQEHGDALAALTSRLKATESSVEARRDETRALVKRDLLEAQERSARSDADLGSRLASLVARCNRLEAQHAARRQEMDAKLAAMNGNSAAVGEEHLERHTAALSELQERHAGIPEQIASLQAKAQALRADMLEKIDGETQERFKENNALKYAISLKMDEQAATEAQTELRTLVAKAANAATNAVNRSSSTEQSLRERCTHLSNQLRDERSARAEEHIELRRQLAQLQARNQLLLENHDERLLGIRVDEDGQLQPAAPALLAQLPPSNTASPPPARPGQYASRRTPTGPPPSPSSAGGPLLKPLPEDEEGESQARAFAAFPAVGVVRPNLMSAEGALLAGKVPAISTESSAESESDGVELGDVTQQDEETARSDGSGSDRSRRSSDRENSARSQRSARARSANSARQRQQQVNLEELDTEGEEELMEKGIDLYHWVPDMPSAGSVEGSPFHTKPSAKEAPPDGRQPPAEQRTLSECEAATKIQAAYRGHAVRRDGKAELKAGPAAAAPEPAVATEPDAAQAVGQAGSEEASKHSAAGSGGEAPATDPQAAATRIQAAYRGHSVRRRSRSEREAATKIQAAYRGHSVRRKSLGNEATSAPTPTAEEVEEAAATKIQAAYRGHTVRRNSRNADAGATEEDGST